MKSLKWLLEIIYYEVNHKSEKSHDIFPIIGFFIAAIIAFLMPILLVLLDRDLMYITVMFVITPLICLGVYFYFKSHHEEIMNNEEYKKANNRRKIYNITCLVCSLGCMPLGLLVFLLLKSLNLII